MSMGEIFALAKPNITVWLVLDGLELEADLKAFAKFMSPGEVNWPNRIGYVVPSPQYSKAVQVGSRHSWSSC